MDGKNYEEDVLMFDNSILDNAEDSVENGRDTNSDQRSIPEEVYSKKIKGRSRVFFVDLKESSHGKFLKISEKSRGGKKTTVMMDQEDIPAFVEALKEVEALIK